MKYFEISIKYVWNWVGSNPVQISSLPSSVAPNTGQQSPDIRTCHCQDFQDVLCCSCTILKIIIMKKVIFQNFGWKIRVLSPGENGAPSTSNLRSLLFPVLLTTLTAAEFLLWKVNRKCQNERGVWQLIFEEENFIRALCSVQSGNVFTRIAITFIGEASRKLNGAESFCGIKCY